MGSDHTSGSEEFQHADVHAYTLSELERHKNPTELQSEFRVSSDSSPRVGVVVARFNAAITQPLFAGAVDELISAGFTPHQIVAIHVAGAIEIPLAAQRLLAGGCVAVVALGCVIQGETAHFEFVCNAVTDGCMRVSLDVSKPVGFGVITCDTVSQAAERSSVDGGRNAGRDAALAVLDAVSASSA